MHLLASLRMRSRTRLTISKDSGEEAYRPTNESEVVWKLFVTIFGYVVSVCDFRFVFETIQNANGNYKSKNSNKPFRVFPLGFELWYESLWLDHEKMEESEEYFLTNLKSKNSNNPFRVFHWVPSSDTRACDTRTIHEANQPQVLVSQARNAMGKKYAINYHHFTSKIHYIWIL